MRQQSTKLLLQAHRHIIAKQRMVQNANDRELSSLQHNKKGDSIELMTVYPHS